MAITFISDKHIAGIGNEQVVVEDGKKIQCSEKLVKDIADAIADFEAKETVGDSSRFSTM